jgi:hypothetical protein
MQENQTKILVIDQTEKESSVYLQGAVPVHGALEHVHQQRLHLSMGDNNKLCW